MNRRTFFSPEELRQNLTKDRPEVIHKLITTSSADLQNVVYQIEQYEFPVWVCCEVSCNVVKSHTTHKFALPNLHCLAVSLSVVDNPLREA